MVPLRVIISSLQKFAQQGFSLISHHCVNRRIDSSFKEQRTKFKDISQEVPFVCTRADIWSAKNRSFFGVTAYYYISCKYVWKKVSRISLHEISQLHSYDRVTDLLCSTFGSTHTEFDLTQNKIVATITNNRSNFVTLLKCMALTANIYASYLKKLIREQESDEECNTKFSLDEICSFH